MIDNNIIKMNILFLVCFLILQSYAFKLTEPSVSFNNDFSFTLSTQVLESNNVNIDISGIVTKHTNILVIFYFLRILIFYLLISFHNLILFYQV